MPEILGSYSFGYSLISVGGNQNQPQWQTNNQNVLTEQITQIFQIFLESDYTAVHQNQESKPWELTEFF